MAAGWWPGTTSVVGRRCTKWPSPIKGPGIKSITAANTSRIYPGGSRWLPEIEWPIMRLPASSGTSGIIRFT